MERKTHIVSFSKTVQPIRELFADYDQGTRGLQEIVMHELCLQHNLVSIFQVENVSSEKTQKKTLNISGMIRPIFIKFSPK